MREALEPLLEMFQATDRTALIAEASTRLLLDLIGWRGRILRSSKLAGRPGRSQRLADLAAAVGARTYVCGTGGMTYLDPTPFHTAGITVLPFAPPTRGVWTQSRHVSALSPLLRHGTAAVAHGLAQFQAAATVKSPSSKGE